MFNISLLQEKLNLQSRKNDSKFLQNFYLEKYYDFFRILNRIATFCLLHAFSYNNSALWKYFQFYYSVCQLKLRYGGLDLGSSQFQVISKLLQNWHNWSILTQKESASYF
jgi:hypothetical protein